MVKFTRRPNTAALIAFCAVLLILLEVLPALAQTSTVRPPTRRPRNQGSVPYVPPRPSNANTQDGIGTSSTPLSVCERGAVRDGRIDLREFTGLAEDGSRYYVLGLVAPIGGDILASDDLISFWVQPDNGDWIRMSQADLQPIGQAGADLEQVLFIGARRAGNGWDWKAVGRCANFFNQDVDGEGFLYDLYQSYISDPATAPDRPVEPSISDLIVTEFNPNVVVLVPEYVEPLVTVTGLTEEGTLASGSWNNRLTGNEGDIYRFYADEGAVVQVSVSSPIDTVAEIRDENGAVLMIDDDSGGNLNPSLSYELPYSGNFALVVRPYSAGTSGDYGISASLEAASFTSSSFSYLQPGTYSDSIGSDEGDAFLFYGEAGSTVFVTVFGTLDTVAEIYDANGNYLTGNDDTNGFDPYIEYTLPYSGDYTLVIRPYAGGNRGDYTFDLALGGTAASVGCPNLPPPQLYVGATVVVTPGNTTRVRADTSTSAQILTQLRRNTTAQVLSGPVCADNRVWWQVNYGGTVGWSAEVDSDGEYLLMVR
jgi:hypothetical protein